MARILVFIPHMNMRQNIEEIVETMPKYDDVEYKLIYVFGTPESLKHDRDADILVARGMTYKQLKVLHPHKHIIEIKFSSFDIIDALVKCKEVYHAKKIALFLQRDVLNSIEVIEELCNAKIDIYDVCDEITANRAIEEAKLNGADIYVGAGTICGICDNLGLPRVHIETKQKALESALFEAFNAARTINYERAEASLISTMVNKMEDSIIIVDKNGKILAVNNQTYRTFELSTSEDYKGAFIEHIYKGFKWKAVINNESNEEEIIALSNKNYFVQYKPFAVDNAGAGVIITLKNTDAVIEEEMKIRQRLNDNGLIAKYCFDDIIGSSQNMQYSIAIAKKYSTVNSNVLIIGETGTGKELFAHSIHKESSRCKQPFVALNCAALPENLLESELFGYEAGAFSGASKNGKIGLFELAHRGTIFLDEIGEIPCALQAKLLRVLQEKEVRRIGSDCVHPIDVRVISATNINIEKEVQNGKFRSDLYYRLNILDIFIPPLRERNMDIQKLIEYYFTKLSCEMGNPIPSISNEAMKMFTEYSWPGNVRELRNICERLIVLNENQNIGVDLLRQLKIFKNKTIEIENEKAQNVCIDPVYANFKRKKKKKDIADELGVSRTTLWRMSKKQKEQNKYKVE